MRSFKGTVRFWRPEQAGGLAVVDVPADVSTTLGGLKQQRIKGMLNGVPFTSNTMPAGGGRLALTVSRKMLEASGLEVGGEAEFEVERLVDGCATSAELQRSDDRRAPGTDPRRNRSRRPWRAATRLARGASEMTSAATLAA